MEGDGRAKGGLLLGTFPSAASLEKLTLSFWPQHEILSLRSTAQSLFLLSAVPPPPAIALLLLPALKSEFIIAVSGEWHKKSRVGRLPACSPLAPHSWLSRRPALCFSTHRRRKGQGCKPEEVVLGRRVGRGIYLASRELGISLPPLPEACYLEPRHCSLRPKALTAHRDLGGVQSKDKICSNILSVIVTCSRSCKVSFLFCSTAVTKNKTAQVKIHKLENKPQYMIRFNVCKVRFLNTTLPPTYLPAQDSWLWMAEKKDSPVQFPIVTHF